MDLKESSDLIIPDDRRHPWEVVRVKIIQQLIIKHCSSFENTTVVDIGCGDVFLLNKIKQLFTNPLLLGVDSAFSEGKIQKLKQTYSSDNFHFFNSTEALSKTKIKADIVLLLDVLEHIKDDILFLKKTCRNEWIDRNTLFVITVPAFNVLFNRHDKFLGHFRRYSNKTLKKTLENSGFEIIETGYFFFSLLPIRLACKLIENALPSLTLNNKGIGLWNGKRITTCIVVVILKIDFSLSSFMKKLGIKIPGLSNFAICRILA